MNASAEIGVPTLSRVSRTSGADERTEPNWDYLVWDIRGNQSRSLESTIRGAQPGLAEFYRPKHHSRDP